MSEIIQNDETGWIFSVSTKEELLQEVLMPVKENGQNEI